MPSDGGASEARALLISALDTDPLDARHVEARLCELLELAPLEDADPLRIRVWRALLGLHGQAFDEAALTARVVSFDGSLPNQRVVAADASRTRPDIAAFRESAPRIERLLTYFAAEGWREGSSEPQQQAGAVPYRQGLNEILAGVLLAGSSSGGSGATTPSGEAPAPSPLAGLSDGLAVALTARIVACFAPRVYASRDDAEFLSLQCSLQLFRLAMQYADPQLAKHLAGFGCTPELYALPWFLTVFSRNTPPPALLALWDFLLAASRSPGPALLHSVALAFLLSHRAAVLGASTQGKLAVDLPVVLAGLAFRDVAHVRDVCAHALQLHRELPLCFRRLVTAVCYGGSGGANPSARVGPSLLARLEARLCIKISVEEMLAGSGARYAVAAGGAGAGSVLRTGGSAAHPNAASARALAVGGLALLALEDSQWELPPQYLILDVRGEGEVKYGGALPTAYHADPRAVRDAEALAALLATFEGLHGVHIAVCGEGALDGLYHSPVPPGAAEGGAAALSSAAASAATAADAALLAPLSALETDDYSPTCVSRTLALMLVQRDFPRVSDVEGGFTALHQLQAHHLDDVLVGHAPGFCNVCTGGRAAALLLAQAEVDAASAAILSPRARAPSSSSAVLFSGGDGERSSPVEGAVPPTPSHSRPRVGGLLSSARNVVAKLKSELAVPPPTPKVAVPAPIQPAPAVPTPIIQPAPAPLVSASRGFTVADALASQSLLTPSSRGWLAAAAGSFSSLQSTAAAAVLAVTEAAFAEHSSEGDEGGERPAAGRAAVAGVSPRRAPASPGATLTSRAD